MAVNKVKYRKINNSYFNNFCQLLCDLLMLDKQKVVSNMKEASLDDNNKKEKIYLYDGKFIDMDTIKLDDMTSPFLKYMENNRNLKNFEQPPAVDAVCINKDNEWFLIEFKNCPIYKKPPKENELNSEVVSSIRRKMLGSLWFLLTLFSFTNNAMFGDDVTDFARNHITYIAVVSREKNPKEYRRIRESYKNFYTPDFLKKYVGYYFKDVYMLTENELCTFIKNFN